jgi:hypothetical protein
MSTRTRSSFNKTRQSRNGETSASGSGKRIRDDKAIEIIEIAHKACEADHERQMLLDGCKTKNPYAGSCVSILLTAKDINDGTLYNNLLARMSPSPVHTFRNFTEWNQIRDSTGATSAHKWLLDDKFIINTWKGVEDNDDPKKHYRTFYAEACANFSNSARAETRSKIQEYIGANTDKGARELCELVVRAYSEIDSNIGAYENTDHHKWSDELHFLILEYMSRIYANVNYKAAYEYYINNVIALYNHKCGRNYKDECTMLNPNAYIEEEGGPDYSKARHDMLLKFVVSPVAVFSEPQTCIPVDTIEKYGGDDEFADIDPYDIVGANMEGGDELTAQQEYDRTYHNKN